MARINTRLLLIALVIAAAQFAFAQNRSNIMDHYITGDGAPIGRLSFSYRY